MIKFMYNENVYIYLFEIYFVFLLKLLELGVVGK